MKNRIITLALVLLLLAVCLCITVLADGERDGGPVWEITDSAGNVSLSYGYFDGLSNVADGDTLRLIPDYIELDTVYTLRTDKQFTVDLGDSTVVYPSNTITTPVFVINGSTDVTFIGDGANIYLQDNVRSFISVSDTASVTFIGSGQGIGIYAPDAVDAGGTATVTLRNVHFMKNSGNMMGLVCARASSTVTAYDSTFVSKAGGNAVYSCANGKMSLYNCSVISLDATNGAQVADSATLYAEETLFSCSMKNVGGFTAGAGCYLAQGITAKYPASAEAVSLKLSSAPTVNIFVAPSSFEAVAAAKMSVTTYVKTVSGVTDTPTEASVWRVENELGNYYTDDFLYPLVNSREGDRLMLLRDVSLPYISGESILADLIDLGGYSISVGLPAGLSGDDVALFNVGGSGELTLRASGSFELAGLLLSTSRSTALELEGATLTLGSLVRFSGDSLTVKGGTVRTASTAINAIGNSSVTIDGTGVISDATAVSAGGEVTVQNSLLASTSNGPAIVTLAGASMLGDSYIYGSVDGSTVIAENGVKFNTPPTQNAKFLVKPLPSAIENDLCPGLFFNYECADPTRSVRASFTMSSDVLLSVYVPDYVYLDSAAFTLISIDGMTYTPSAADGKSVELDGEGYTVFIYPQVHIRDVLSDGVIRFISFGNEFTLGFTVSELMLESLRQSSNTSFSAAAATYLDLAYSAVGHTPEDGVAELIYPYVSTSVPPIPTAPDTVRTTFFDAERGVIDIYGAEGVTLNRVVITWGKKQIVIRAEDGVIECPFLRLDPGASITLDYFRDGKHESVEIGILSLYAPIEGSSGHSAALFRKYIAYLYILSKA